MTLRIGRSKHVAPAHHLIAADIMAANPKSIGRAATARDTAEFFKTHGIHTAPVIDEAGRPLGVVNRTDLLDYWGRRRDRLTAIANGEATVDSSNAGPDGAIGDPLVTEIMTPVVFCVPSDTLVARIIEKILALEVRCLFVTDEHDLLVGVVSVFDLLRSAANPAGKGRLVRPRPLRRAVSALAPPSLARIQTKSQYTPYSNHGGRHENY